MREEYHNKLKIYFRNKLLLARGKLNLTQEQMSERLEISLRNYSELERGKNSCNALTLALFLIYCCPDVKQFLNELKELYEADESPKTNEKLCQ